MLHSFCDFRGLEQKLFDLVEYLPGDAVGYKMKNGKEENKTKKTNRKE
jgi:hypothetical protein